jgi:hypothetical protein
VSNLNNPDPSLRLVQRDDLLLCPGCGEAEGLHVDHVVALSASGQWLSVAAGGEDERAALTVDESTPYSRPSSVDGRRHSFILGAWCELCGGTFGIELRQHKGVTMVDVARKQSMIVGMGDANFDADRGLLL